MTPTTEERADLERRLAQAVRELPGLRPTTPAMTRMLSWAGRDLDTLAIDVGPATVTIRLIATGLPLGPHLENCEVTVQKLLAGTPYAAAELRLVVTDIDAEAFTAE